MTLALCPLGRTGLHVHPLCFGGNVFGWTANEATSFEILDAYVAAGGNFVDTADAYSYWVPGNVGGESEAILGRWMAARGNRSRMIIATKVGLDPEHAGLSRANIEAAVAGSLTRLQTDTIDLYYAHKDDPKTPLLETVLALDALVKAGKVRHLGASNYDAPRLLEALAVAKGAGARPFEVLQPEYNLMVRADFEGAVRDVCEKEGLACLPYFSLARGFLTGKYRAGVTVDSARASGATAYLGERGNRVLKVLGELADAHRVKPAAVALAWLVAQKTVASVLSSARTLQQLKDILPMAELRLSTAEIAALTEASA
jgi:aryl-alcohol dehydrogenase (NADP+)